MLDNFQLVLSISIISIVIFFVFFIFLILCLFYSKHKNINDCQIDSDVESYIIRDSNKLKNENFVKCKSKANDDMSCCSCFKKSKTKKKSNKNLLNHENLLFNGDNGEVSENEINARNGTNSELGSSRLSCIDRELPPLPAIPANISELNNSKSSDTDQCSLLNNKHNFNTISSTDKSPQKSHNSDHDGKNDKDNAAYAIDVVSTNEDKACKCNSPTSNNTKSHINKKPDASSIAEFDPTYAMINGLSASTTPTNHNHKPAIVIPITTEIGEIEFLLVCPNCGGNMTTTSATVDNNNSQSNNSCWTSLHDVYNNHGNNNKINTNNLAFCTPLRRNTAPSTEFCDVNSNGVVNNENLFNASTYASIAKLPKETIDSSTGLSQKISRQRSISQNDIINAVLMQNHIRKTMTIDSSTPATGVKQQSSIEMERQSEQNQEDAQHQDEKSTNSVWSLKCSSCASTTNIYQHPDIHLHQQQQQHHHPNQIVGVPDRKYGQSIVDMIEKLRKISHHTSGSETPCSVVDGYNNQSFYTDDADDQRVTSSQPPLSQSRELGRSSTPNFSLLSPSSSWSSSQQRANRVLHWSPPSCQMTHSREGPLRRGDHCFTSVVLRSSTGVRHASSSSTPDKRLARPSSVASPMTSVNRFLAINCGRKMSPLFHPVLTPPPLSPMEGNNGLNTCFKPENMDTLPDTNLPGNVADKPKPITMNMDKSTYYEDLSEYEKVTGIDKEVESIYSMKQSTKVEIPVKLDDPPPPRRIMNKQIFLKSNLDRPKSETDSIVYAFPNKPSKPSHLILQDKMSTDEIQSNIPGSIITKDQQDGSNQSTARMLCQLPPSYQRLMSSEDSCAKSPLSTEPSPLTENTVLNDTSGANPVNAGDNKSCASSSAQSHYIIPSSLSSKGYVKQFNWSSSLSSSSSSVSNEDKMNSIAIDVYETLE